MIDKATPEEWGLIFGIQVLDPDGWRVDGKPFSEPIEYDEWVQRLGTSTIKGDYEALL